MTAYGRTVYGSNPLAGAARNNAAARGWGPGWPNAQESKMITVAGGGVKVRVRREIGPLVATLLALTDKTYNLKPGACWGFANRPIRGTKTASNHSWGLAVDLNAEDNPMSTTFHTDIPPAVVKAWESCHFYWGGRYANRPDPMHFEYVGRPADVAADLKRAAALLNPSAPVVAPPLDRSLVMKQWRIDKATRAGQKPTETLSNSEAYWVSWYRRSLGILLTRKKVTYDGRETFLSLVQRFQKAYGLVPDGIPGPKTVDALRRLAGYRVQD
jgi:hypothetical protein